MKQYIQDNRKALGSIKLDEAFNEITAHFQDRNEALIAEGKKPRFGAQEKMITEMKRFLEEVCAPQLAAGSFHLDLNDKDLSEKLNLSERRVKQLRLELKAAGIIFFREGTKPKYKGQYPNWMIVAEFLNYEKPTYKKRTIKNSKYNNQYHELKSEAKANVRKLLQDNDMIVPVTEFVRKTNAEFERILFENNLSKAQLLKK